MLRYTIMCFNFLYDLMCFPYSLYIKTLASRILENYLCGGHLPQTLVNIKVRDKNLKAFSLGRKQG